MNGISGADIEDIFSYARHGRVGDIERLLDRGIPINVRDSFGSTLLVIACQNGNKRVAKSVLRRGGDINSRNHKGNTNSHHIGSFAFIDVTVYKMSAGHMRYIYVAIHDVYFHTVI